MKSKTRFLITTLMVFMMLLATASTFSTAEDVLVAQPDNVIDHKLIDLPLFKDINHDGWAGGDADCIETVDWNLPVDNTVIYNDLPSLKINVTSDGSWWIAILAVWGWQTYTLEDYYENGSLEFDIKGKDGGESFMFALKDRLDQGTDYNIKDFVDITTEWQHVSIPLKDIISTDVFSLKYASQLNFGKDYGAANQVFTVWLNDIKITSPDSEKTFPEIKVNQVGYTPDSEKYALVSGFAELLNTEEGKYFYVKSADDDRSLFVGKLKLITDLDPRISGEKVLAADFSKFTRPGTYYISVKGIPDSFTFTIGKDIYAPLLRDASRYYYYQRANLALEEPYAEGFPHDVFHPDDADCPFLSDMEGEKRDVSQGWYDAGDFGKYVNAGATAISDLLWTYELYPELFTDNQFNIPESGNGVPDILDEVKYELDWLLKMQDTDGGFFGRVWPQNENDGTPRYIDDVRDGRTRVKSTAHTASVVGAFAHSYLVFKDVDAEFADTLLAAAEKGWEWLVANPETLGSVTGPYHDDEDASDRLYAAATLFRVTGQDEYNDYFKSHYRSFTNIYTDRSHYVGNMQHIAMINYMNADNPSKVVENWFKKNFKKWSNDQLKRSQENVWRNTLKEEEYIWGSNMPVLNSSMVLILGNRLLDNNDKRIIDVTRANLNYVLGINPMSYSYVSGYGENCHKDIFSGIYTKDGKVEVPKGYMAGGANKVQGDWLSRFYGKCYLDSGYEWTTNEHTIYWNSGLVFSTAACLDAAQ